MAFNNGKTKSGDSDRNVFDMGAQSIWDVADNYNAGGGNDEVYGNIADNVIRGGQGHDYINGKWGNDTLWGGLDNDTLLGDQGDDLLRGEEGNDLLKGGDGNDKLYGGIGLDTLHGGNGGDELFGGAGSDKLYGGEGNDKLDGGTGSDTLYGGSGNDKLFDGAGNTKDYLYGGSGRDEITVQGGGDLVEAGSGDDKISIGNAAAFRQAGGNIEGGTGIDTLVLRDATDVTLSSSWIDGVEKFDLNANSDQTLRVSAGAIDSIADADSIRILGEAGDRVFLDDASGQFPGGRWVQGALSDPNSTGDQFRTWNYVDSSGDTTGINAVIDTDVQVQLV